MASDSDPWEELAPNGHVDASDSDPWEEEVAPKGRVAKKRKRKPAPKSKAKPTSPTSKRRRITPTKTKMTKKAKQVAEVKDKLQGGHPNYNEALTKILAELGANEKNSGNHFKAVAYFRAVNSLKKYTRRVSSGKEAQALPGVGAKIAKKIDEILSTGGLERLEADRKRPEIKAVNELTRVSGIGPKMAQRLYLDHNISSLPQLNAHKSLLNKHQRIGLKYVKDFEAPIPRTEVCRLGEYVQRVAQALDPHLLVTVCGSYRRGKQESGDVDILITRKGWAEGDARPRSVGRLVPRLQELGFLTDTLGDGPTKYMGVCKLPPKADAGSPNTNTPSTLEAKASTACHFDVPSLESDSDSDNEPETPHNLFFSPVQASAPASATNVEGLLDETVSENMTVAKGKRAKATSAMPRQFHRRIDLRFIPYTNYYCAVLYFTGSGPFNQDMRLQALQKGFTLNEYSLCPLVKNKDGVATKGPPLPIDSEQDVFSALGMDYVLPENRNW